MERVNVEPKVIKEIGIGIIVSGAILGGILIITAICLERSNIPNPTNNSKIIENIFFEIHRLSVQLDQIEQTIINLMPNDISKTTELYQELQKMQNDLINYYKDVHLINKIATAEDKEAINYFLQNNSVEQFKSINKFLKHIKYLKQENLNIFYLLQTVVNGFHGTTLTVPPA